MSFTHMVGEESCMHILIVGVGEGLQMYMILGGVPASMHASPSQSPFTAERVERCFVGLLCWNLQLITHGSSTDPGKVPGATPCWIWPHLGSCYLVLVPIHSQLKRSPPCHTPGLLCANMFSSSVKFTSQTHSSIWVCSMSLRRQKWLRKAPHLGCLTFFGCQFYVM